MARRAWLTPEDVVNTYSTPKIAAISQNGYLVTVAEFPRRVQHPAHAALSFLDGGVVAHA